MQDTAILTNPYFAGRIKRYHAWPTLYTQVIGEHTWQVMRIWFAIWGPMPPEVSTHLLFHDAPELSSGDIPFIAKRDAPAIRAPLDQLEALGCERMGIPNPNEVGLKGMDRVRFKVCDNIEMLEFALVEMAMGNNLAQPIVNNCFTALREKQIPELGIEDVVKVGEYIARVIKAARVYGLEVDDFYPQTKVKEAAE